MGLDPAGGRWVDDVPPTVAGMLRFGDVGDQLGDGSLAASHLGAILDVSDSSPTSPTRSENSEKSETQSDSEAIAEEAEEVR